MTLESCIAVNPRISIHEDVILPHMLSNVNFNGRIFLLARVKDRQLWYTTREKVPGPLGGTLPANKRKVSLLASFGGHPRD